MGIDHKTPIVHDGEVVWPEVIEPIETMRAKLAAKLAAKLEKYHGNTRQME
jgi:hypothetical protein